MILKSTLFSVVLGASIISAIAFAQFSKPDEQSELVFSDKLVPSQGIYQTPIDSRITFSYSSGDQAYVMPRVIITALGDVQFLNNGVLALTIKPGGQVEYGPGWSGDDESYKFWQSLQWMVETVATMRK